MAKHMETGHRTKDHQLEPDMTLSWTTVTCQIHKKNTVDCIAVSKTPQSTDMGSGDIAWFRILERLGGNEVGESFKARDLYLNRLVLLEVLDLSQDLARSRLEAARKVCGLNHPTIFTVYDLAEQDDRAYIAMEWVEGRSLRKWIPADGLPWREVRIMAQHLAGGLAFIHDKDLAHGKLTPDSVRVYDDGNVKLTSFWFVSYAGSNPEPDPLCEIDPNPQGDVHAFGRILLFMLTGLQPAISHDNPITVPTNTPRECKDLIVACIQENSTMSEVALRMNQLPEKPRSPSMKFKGALALVALLATLLIVWFQKDQLKAPVDTLNLGMAVLPFANPGGDPQIDVFSNGLVASMSTRLSQAGQNLKGFWVAPVDEIGGLERITRDGVQKQFDLDLLFTGEMIWKRTSYQLEFKMWDARAGQELSRHVLDIPSEALLENGNRVMEKAVSMLEARYPQISFNTLTPLDTKISEAYRYYLQGQGYLYRAEEFDHLVLAEEAFQKAVEADPHLAPAYLGWSQTLLYHWNDHPDQGILDLARQLTDRAEQLNAHDPGIWLVRAMILEKLGDSEGSIPLFSKVLEVDPKNMHAKLGLARSMQDLERMTEAERYYLEASAEHPKDPLVAKQLGSFYFRAGNYEKSEQVYCRLIALAPNHYHSYRRMGLSLLLMDRYDEALTYFNKALVLKPDEDYIYNNIGAIYILREQPEKAIPFYETATLIAPRSTDHWHHLGYAMQLSPEHRHLAPPVWAKAIALLRDAIKTAPGKDNYYMELALCLARSGETGLAIEELKKVSPSNSVKYLIYKAQVYESAGRRTEALSALASLLKDGYPLSGIYHPVFKELRADPRFHQLVQDTDPIRRL